MNIGIYGIICLINRKIYIGSTGDSRGIKRRFTDHRSNLRRNKHPNIHLQSAWNLYGENNFEFRILEECHNNDNLIEKEQKWIDTYDSMNETKGYNLKQAGGCGKHSEQTRRKMSIAHKGMKLSEEIKRKISIANVGQKRSEETKQNISKSKKGGKLSEETKRLISNWQRGRRKSDETRKKMSLYWRGRKRIGMRWLDKPVNMLSLTGEFIRRFDSMAIAERFLDAKSRHIGSCCRGVRKSAYGYKWEYAKQEGAQGESKQKIQESQVGIPA